MGDRPTRSSRIGHRARGWPIGGKLCLKAKAVNGGGDQFLLIEGTEGDRHRGMLQKTGESELKHLTRWAAKEHEEELLWHTSTILERLVDERTQELNESTSMLRREVEVCKRAEAQAREAVVEN